MSATACPSALPAPLPSVATAPAHAVLADGRARVVEARLQALHRAGAAALPHVALDFRAYLRAAFRRGLSWSEDTIAAPPCDLYLAAACEESVPDAWAVLLARYEPVLRRDARRLGASACVAEELAADVLADLCCASVNAPGRMRLARFTGRGSLRAWLGAMLRRRLVRLRERARRVHAVESRAGGEACVGQEENEPAAEILRRENRALMRGCLSTARALLSPREAAVLRHKYLDGCSQRETARRLGVGEPRISRIHTQALARLRAALRRGVDGGGA